MDELLKEKADELARLIKQKRVLSEEVRLAQRMAEHAKTSVTDLERRYASPELIAKFTGK